MQVNGEQTHHIPEADVVSACSPGSAVSACAYPITRDSIPTSRSRRQAFHKLPHPETSDEKRVWRSFPDVYFWLFCCTDYGLPVPRSRRAFVAKLQSPASVHLGANECLGGLSTVARAE
jgi:hypothetical protein